MAAIAAQRTGLAGRWQRLWSSHPELWVVAVSAFAWLLLLTPRDAEPHQHGSQTPLSALLDETLAWGLMVAAMMLPVVLGSARVAVARSLWSRRHRAMAWFLLGYVAVWLMTGFVVAFATTILVVSDWPQPYVGAVALVLAAAWQQLPLRRALSLRCHARIPLAPSGWPADRDCLRYGWLIGERCLLSCWPLMLACVATRHSLLAIAALGVAAVIERYSGHPDMRAVFGLPLVAAGVYGAMPFLVA